MKPRISLEEAIVEAGGVVKGWLKLPKKQKISSSSSSSSSPSPSGSNTEKLRQLNDLSMYFTGEEQTAVEHWNRNRKRERLDKKIARENNRFLKLKITKPKPAQIVETSDDLYYKVPFSVELPSDIPSSMDFRDGNNLARVVYYVRAHFGVCFGTSHPHKEVIVHAEAQPKLKVPHMIQHNTQQLKSFALCTRGEMSYGVKIWNTQLLPGEKVRIQMFLINNTWVQLKGIHIELCQVTRCMAQDYRSKCVQTLCEAKFKRSGGQKYYEGGFGQVDPQRRYKQMMSQMNQPPTRRTKTLDLPPIPTTPKTTTTTTSFGEERPIIVTACDTYEGNRIRVTHDVRITIKTKSFSNNFEIRFPVRLVKSTFEELDPDDDDDDDDDDDSEDDDEKRQPLGQQQISRKQRSLGL